MTGSPVSSEYAKPCAPRCAHQPHTGGCLIDSYPWYLALDKAGNTTDPADGELNPSD